MTDWRAETVFCDDIRQEFTGKHILIGVYGADLVPGVLPGVFSIAMWVRFWSIAQGRHRFDMRLIDPSGREAGNITAETNIARNDAPSVIAVSGIPVNVEKPGDIVVLCSVDGEDPIEVGRLKVSPPMVPVQPPPNQSS